MHAKYLDRFYRGETLAAARLMSIVEKGGEEAEAILNTLFRKVGRAYRIGVTGLTGAGKSTLVNEMAQRLRRKDLTVGVVAEDPTSPFSGGAILGDRVRMMDAAGDEGVFIRSIASRGSQTGLSACATELADILDAFGRDFIFLETIGIGQLEYKIHFSAHTTVVVLTPDAGDDVQSMKSGLMEIGEIFAVNKADRSPARRFADDLRSMLDLRSSGQDWLPPVVETVALKGEGVDELMSAVERHRSYINEGDRFERRRIASLENRIRMVTEEKLQEFFWQDAYIEEKLTDVLKEVVSGKKSPYEAANEIVAPLSLRPRRGGTR